jgi:predicted hydrocarbon binding protein
MIMAKVKGVALLSRLQMLKEHFGDAAFHKIVGELTQDSRDLLTGGGVISSSWYPAEVLKDLDDSIAKTLKASHPRAMEELGEMTAQMGLTTIHKLKIKTTPEDTFTRVPQLWSAFHDTGEMDIESAPGKATFRIKGYGMPHRTFCRNLVGWANKMVELSGGKNVSTKETKCVCNGDDCCEMVVTWD